MSGSGEVRGTCFRRSGPGSQEQANHGLALRGLGSCLKAVHFPGRRGRRRRGAGGGGLDGIGGAAGATWPGTARWVPSPRRGRGGPWFGAEGGVATGAIRCAPAIPGWQQKSPRPRALPPAWIQREGGASHCRDAVTSTRALRGTSSGSRTFEQGARWPPGGCPDPHHKSPPFSFFSWPHLDGGVPNHVEPTPPGPDPEDRGGLPAPTHLQGWVRRSIGHPGFTSFFRSHRPVCGPPPSTIRPPDGQSPTPASARSPPSLFPPPSPWEGPGPIVRRPVVALVQGYSCTWAQPTTPTTQRSARIRIQPPDQGTLPPTECTVAEGVQHPPCEGGAVPGPAPLQPPSWVHLIRSAKSPPARASTGRVAKGGAERKPGPLRTQHPPLNRPACSPSPPASRGPPPWWSLACSFQFSPRGGTHLQPHPS